VILKARLVKDIVDDVVESYEVKIAEADSHNDNTQSSVENGDTCSVALVKLLCCIEDQQLQSSQHDKYNWLPCEYELSKAVEVEQCTVMVYTEGNTIPYNDQQSPQKICPVENPAGTRVSREIAQETFRNTCNTPQSPSCGAILPECQLKHSRLQHQ
jgi:hypothetical protein